MHGGLKLTPGPVKFYEGPTQPAESVAVIENDPNMFLVSIDGQSLRRWTQSHDVVVVAVLPGRHVVVAQPSARGGFVSMEAVRIDFIAEAGHRYVASRRIGGGTVSTTWTPVFMDATTGKEIGP
jgi:hypothetical protein